MEPKLGQEALSCLQDFFCGGGGGCLNVQIHMFVCLGFIVPLENFSLIWGRHHSQWRASNFTYARQSWPLSSVGSLSCHTHCDTGHPFIMVISEDPWHSHLLPSIEQRNCHYLLRLRSEHPTFRLQGQHSNPLLHRRTSNPFEKLVM